MDRDSTDDPRGWTQPRPSGSDPDRGDSGPEEPSAQAPGPGGPPHGETPAGAPTPPDPGREGTEAEGSDPADPAPDSGDDRPVHEAVRLWGSEHPKLSAPGWRRTQRLERVPPASRGSGVAVPGDAPAQAPDALASAVEGLRTDTERRLSALAASLEELARGMHETLSSGLETSVRQELEGIREAVVGSPRSGEGSPVDGGGLVGRLEMLERALAEQDERFGTALAAQSDRLNAILDAQADTIAARISAQAESVAERVADQPGDAPGTGRLAAQIEGIKRRLGEMHARLPDADELGALVQSEIKTVRSDILRLGEGGDRDRLQAVESGLAELTAAVAALTARMDDLPPADAFGEILRAESERTRAEAQESGSNVRDLLDDVRSRADRIEADIAELGARYDAARLDPERLLGDLRAEQEATRRDLLRAAETTDAKARTVLASIAREVLTLTDAQRELRDEIRRLAARVTGRSIP